MATIPILFGMCSEGAAVPRKNIWNFDTAFSRVLKRQRRVFAMRYNPAALHNDIFARDRAQLLRMLRQPFVLDASKSGCGGAIGRRFAHLLYEMFPSHCGRAFFHFCLHALTSPSYRFSTSRSSAMSSYRTRDDVPLGEAPLNRCAFSRECVVVCDHH